MDTKYRRLPILWPLKAGRLFLSFILGYLKDSNAAAHSVGGEIFYVVIYLSVRSKTCMQ